LQAWLSPQLRLISRASCVFTQKAFIARGLWRAPPHTLDSFKKIGTPEEWGQGGGAYGKRFASTVGCSGIHAILAFGLDSALHQDPRYFRSRRTGFWRRTAHALKGTILTRTNSGRETVSTWRLGSAYGAAFLSNQWYPDRLNTVRLGALQGSLQLGFDFASNVGAEFLPDLKRKIPHRKPSLAPNDLQQGRP
jgi:hypothetical protein